MSLGVHKTASQKLSGVNSLQNGMVRYLPSMAISWNSNSAVQESGLKQQLLLSNWLRNTELCFDSIFIFIFESINLTAYVFKEVLSYVGIYRYMHKLSHIID